jgi:beta-galactosidase
MNNLGQNTAAMRIVFERNADASYHKLKYEKNGVVKETPATLNNFIDVSGLNIDDEYKLSLMAVNSLGESEPAVANVKIVTEYLPPLVLYTEPANNGFFIGYPSTDEDYRFEVQYTAKPGDYAAAESLQTTNKGVLYVPGLKNGQTYYYRMRSWKANNYTSPWSNEIKVVPDGGQMPAEPSLLGIVKQGKEAMLFFKPQKKATGYIVEYSIAGNNNWQQKMINASQINNYFLTGLDANKSYEFRMLTLNENGKSVYSAIKKSL